MAAEYRLNFTAKEIDEKLSSIDNKQDKLTFETSPIEGSENPITSGGVYSALQNAGGIGSSGNTTLSAEDYLEIKDGVIRSTLGDIIEGYEEDYDVFFSFDLENLAENDDNYAQELMTPLDTWPVEIGDEIEIVLSRQGEEDQIFSSTIIMYNPSEEAIYDTIIFGTNFEFNGGEPAFSNEQDFGIVFAIPCMYDNYLMIMTNKLYKNGTVFLRKKIISEKTKRLPDNALKAGNLIEINDGIISSTLGKSTITTKTKEILNISELSWDSETNDQEEVLFYNIDEIGKYSTLAPPKENSIATIELKLKNSEDSIIFEELPIETIFFPEDNEYCLLDLKFNTTVGMWEIEMEEAETFSKIDENKVCGNIVWTKSLEDDFVYPDEFIFIVSEEIDSIKITITYQNIKTQKVPNDALSFDKIPTEGSSNLIKSGDFYNLIEDDKPRKDSEKLITSGAVYDSMPVKKGSNQSYCLNNRSLRTGQASQCWSESTYQNCQQLTNLFNGASYSGDGEAEIYYDSSVYYSYIVKIEVGTSFDLNLFKTRLSEYDCLEFNSTNVASWDLDSCVLNDKYLVIRLRNQSFSEINRDQPTKISRWDIYVVKNPGNYSHSEGNGFASGDYSHAEGISTIASGSYSHAEGSSTASGSYSHAEGCDTTASGPYSHTEGYNTTAFNQCSHAEGEGTIAYLYQHVQGRYNIEDPDGKYSHIVGNGSSNYYRSNSHTLDDNGNAWYKGSVQAENGFILKAPNGTYYKITVDNNGNLSAVQTTSVQ